MIYIFTALYCEAHALIRRLQLVKNQKTTRLQEFCNEQSGIRLTITGVGEIAAAVAVSSICTVYPPAEDDLMLNIGTCAYTRSAGAPQTRVFEDGEGVFLCNQIFEQATGRSFYPDMLYRHPFREASIVTGMVPWSAEASKTTDSDIGHAGVWFDGNGYGRASGDAELFHVGQGTLYDMEAAGIYQAGAHFFGPHQMIFLKIVSDFGTADGVSPGQVERLMEMHGDALLTFIGQLLERMTDERQRDTSPEAELADKLCRDLHCSKTMEASLKQHLHYLALAGADVCLLIQNLYKEGIVPCRDKREGKLRLEELKRTLF